MPAAAWTVCGLGLTLVATALIVLNRALLHDRSRGRRRRCPRCWYSFEGILVSPAHTTRCPECGKEVRKERELLRTRRYWRAAAIGAALLCVGLGITTRPLWKEGRWVRLVPGWALVRLATAPPSADGQIGPLTYELFLRAQEDERPRLEPEDLRSYFDRCFRKAPELPRTVIATREVWPEGESVWVVFDPYAHVFGETLGLVDRSAVRASVRLCRTTAGTPGPWRTIEPLLGPIPELWELGEPDRHDPGLEVRLEDDERVLWQGTVDAPFEIAPPSSERFIGVSDEATDASIERWLRPRLSLWDRGPVHISIADPEGDRPPGLAFGAFVEIYSEEGALLGTGEIVLHGRHTQRRYISEPLVWAGELPLTREFSFARTTIVLRGSSTLALRDFDRFNPRGGRQDLSKYWSGGVRIEPTRQEPEGQ